MDCRVVVEAAVPVYDVETADEAVRIAIAKTGEMLNPDLNYVEIDMRERTTSKGEQLLPAFIAADEALVALELEMAVFNVEHEEHASRIARKEIGQRLESVPLKVLRVEPIEEDGDDDDNGDEEEVEGGNDEGDNEQDNEVSDESSGENGDKGDADVDGDGEADVSGSGDDRIT